MLTSHRRYPVLLASLIINSFALASCGGGGGGGGGSSGGGGGSQGTLTLSNYNLSFVTNDPAFGPATQQIRATISPAASGTVYIRIVVAGEIQLEVSNVTVTSATSGTADISVPDTVTESLGPGQYTGTIRVTVCTSGPNCTSGVIGTTQTADVTYTINGVTSTANEVGFTIRDDSVSADYSQQVSIQTYPAYSASVDNAWLSVDPVSGGDGDSDVTIDLDRNTIDEGESGLRTANLTVNVDGANSVTLPINVTVAKPQFDQVTPYVGQAGVGNTVVIRGQYLDDLGGTQIDFAPDLTSAGTLANSVQVIGPTELRVSYPALAAGRYLVRMYDDMGAVRDRSSADLVIVDDPGISADFIAYPNNEFLTLNSFAYDAERQSLLMTAFRNEPGLTVDDAVLMRFAYNAGWNAPDVINVPRARALALSADGEDLLVASETAPSGSNQAHLDIFSPDLSTIRQTIDSGFTGDEYQSIAVTSDNRALMIADSPRTTGIRDLHEYRFGTDAVTRVSLPITGFQDWSTIAASGDGQRVFISSEDDGTGEYDVVNDSFMSVGIDSSRSMMDRHGDILVSLRIDDFASPTEYHLEVYDRSYNLLGEVLADNNQFVLAPDGTRLYTVSPGAILRSYDLTAAPVAGQYPEIGTGVVLAGDPGNPLLARMAISPDGRTVFVASSDGIAVQPVN